MNDSTKFNLAALFGNQRVGESANIKITGVTKVPPLTEKRKISWRPLKIEYQLFPLSPGPHMRQLKGEMGGAGARVPQFRAPRGACGRQEEEDSELVRG